MACGVVVLINLSSAETREFKQILARLGAEEDSQEALVPIAVSTGGEAQSRMPHENVRLVVLRVDPQQRRPERQLRRLRRVFLQSVPVLVLVPAESIRRIQHLVRAGADEYWILPLDSQAFPLRLQVLLEFGQERIRSGRPRFAGDSRPGSLLSRIGKNLRRLVASLTSPSPVVTKSFETLIANKWRRLRRLGFGSFGEVCLVQEEGTAGLAVAKIPHSEKMNTKFLHEAAILKALTGHPHAVQLREVVNEAGKVILIQEYVEGVTLYDRLAQGMDSRARERAYLQLLEVVAFAHSKNVMHRDVKPENIIITPSGNLKLLDFGTSKNLTRGSVSNTVIGSRPYMAPEQILGKSRIGSDVWALGVVLYSLATEFLPFYDENEKRLMDLILEVDPERPSQLEPRVPPELESIILKCLEKDWTKRYRQAMELHEDLLHRFPQFGMGQVLPEF